VTWVNIDGFNTQHPGSMWLLSVSAATLATVTTSGLMALRLASLRTSNATADQSTSTTRSLTKCGWISADTKQGCWLPCWTGVQRVNSAFSPGLRPLLLRFWGCIQLVCTLHFYVRFVSLTFPRSVASYISFKHLTCHAMPACMRIDLLGIITIACLPCTIYSSSSVAHRQANPRRNV